MSGHSKWSTIKHKGAADAKRGKLFTKLSKAIIVAAKEGGPDPAGNLSLQNAIEKAKSYSMPKDTIERATRGAGTDADAAAYETIVYEGYGPDGVAVLVEALTDNRNRTASDVRHTFAKHGGNLGTTGAVAWLFERRGVVLVEADGADEDEPTLAAAEGGGRRRAGLRRLPGVLGAGGAHGRSRGDRVRDRGAVGGAGDDPEDDRRGGRGGVGEEADPPDRGARGQRRRPGGVGELRHPAAGAGGRRLVGGTSDRVPNLLS